MAQSGQTALFLPVSRFDLQQTNINLKGILHPKMTIRSSSIHPHAMEGWVKFFRPQNTAVVSQEKETLHFNF